ncbi:MAG: cytochrome c biogenesis protein CcsA [Bacteroidota bacterium]|nr:cytochrome c biogenesis protein CcsA [Bacteroidota bacterium]
MIKRFFDALFSVQTASVLVIIFAFVIGFATFIENDFGRLSAKALIFNTWWFELILVILVVTLLINLKRYNLFHKNKLPVLLLHFSFVIIIIGAGVTRYFGFEGMMHIREGESSHSIVSDDIYLQIKIDDRKMEYKYDKKLFLSGITNNKFSIPINFLEYDIDIESKEFLPNVKDTIIEDKFGVRVLHLVVPGDNGMQSEYLFEKQQREIVGHIFTFNNPLEKAINIISDSNDLTCSSPLPISSMRMLDQVIVDYNPNTNFPLSQRTLYSSENLNFVLKDIINQAKKKIYSSSNVMKDGNLDALILEVKHGNISKEVTLFGGKGITGEEISFKLKDLYFNLSYGSKQYYTPFKILLKDFQLERYPGSMSPSSFASEVKVIDKDKQLDKRIFMNNVLDYKGYRFFQSSYDKDEKGTILSVNYDTWGTWISYIGYILLAISTFLILISKKSTRFSALSNKLQKLSQKPLVLVISFLLCQNYTNANELDSVFSKQIIPLKHIEVFEKILVQDNGGRIKPINTFCSEFLRKISRKNEIANQTPTQVIVGMMYNPKLWSKIPMIKVSHPELKELLGKDNEFFTFKDFFDSNGEYKLKDKVNKAYSTPPILRDKLIKDLIAVDERVNICFTIYNGGFLRLFPLQGDSNYTWYASSQYSSFSGKDSLFVSNIMSIYFSSISNSFISNEWSGSDSIASYISDFQKLYGKEVIPADYKINLEVLYNDIDIFSKLFKYYLIIGFLLLIVLFINLFNRTKILDLIVRFFNSLIILGFFFQTLGLITRWIISGHAPWSNGYESMIYIAWATMLAGLIFSRRSNFTLAATSILSSFLLMVAHLNWLDPTITNLVPVLNSYWLMIHVSIITASYGFLALGAILGLISLWIIVFTSNRNKDRLNTLLHELTYINERTLTVGLFMLATGTFLGGVWANESWGRYWGWDPKETWALVSVLVYVFVLHLRLIPKLSSILYFNLSAMSAIKVIGMTYFGVNYYLSGLHSYAAGDPMPIPDFLYYIIGFFIFTIILSSIRFNKLYYKINFGALVLLFLIFYPELFLIFKMSVFQ